MKSSTEYRGFGEWKAALAACIAMALALLPSCAHEMDGQAPTLVSVSAAGASDTGQAALCLAQGPSALRLSGADFLPIVRDGLSDAPLIEMPQVELFSAAESHRVPNENVAFPPGELSRTLLDVELPASFVPPQASSDEAVSYGIRVINPNGKAAVLNDALLVAPPPELLSLAPQQGAQGSVVELELSGLGFWPGMQLSLDATPRVEAIAVTVLSSSSAIATLDLEGVALGTYDLTVSNPIGCSHTLATSFTVIEQVFFELLSIDPPFGSTSEWTTVTIMSNGDFVSTPSVELRSVDAPDAEVVRLARVAFIDSSTLTAVLPPGAPLGNYDVIVRNPPTDGRAGILRNGFRIVQLPILQLNAVLPGRGNTQDDTEVSIFGANFRDPVKVELLSVSQQVTEIAASLAPSSPSEIRTTIPTTRLATGAYLVRVTNLDEQTYSTFSNFLNTNPSGNLEPFQDASPLSSARRMLAGGYALDDLGNRYVYAVGGDGGAGQEVYDTVERSALSKYGRLGEWHEQRHRLSTPRRGATVVMVPVVDASVSPFIPVKTYVYVLGGKNAAGELLGSIERAMVLRAKDAPVVEAKLVEATGGLEEGSWYYQVSAVMPSDDPDNPDGETLASDEAIITVPAGSSVALSWTPVVVDGREAAAYRVYRTEWVNGSSHTERFLAETTDAEYLDDGATAVATQTPLSPGDTGTFTVMSMSLLSPRWGHGAGLVRDEAGARWLVVVGGEGEAGVLDTLERASVSDLAELAAFSSDALAPMSEPRSFFAFMIEDSSNVSTFSPSHGRLWAAGGFSGSLVHDTLERSELTEAGASPWVLNPKKSGQTAGAMGLIANQKLFILGGASGFDGERFSGVVSSGRDSEFDEDGDLTGSINSTANSLLTRRAGGIAVQGAGFFYFIGGSSDGSVALATTEQTF